MKQILIVEDHIGFRQVLAKIFKWNTEVEEDVQVSTLAEGRQRIGHLDGAEAAVMDPGFPDGDGTGLVRELCAAEPDVPIMVLTRSTDPKRHARRRCRAGESAYAGYLRGRNTRGLEDSITCR